MQLKRIVRVEIHQLVESDSSSSVHVCYSPSDSVISLKHRLELLTGIPALSQSLCLASSQLTDSATLHSLSISRNAVPTLYMHVPIRGGASKPDLPCIPFEFKDITKVECFEKCSFASSGPKYRCLGKGINFEATCSNRFCISVRENNTVEIPKGMYPLQGGYMSIRSQVFELVCPACHCDIPPENCTNLLFTDCTAEIKWVLADRCSSKGKLTLITGKGEYKQGKPTVGIIHYHSLDVTLK